MKPEFQKVIDPLFCSLIEISQRSDRMSVNELTVELTREFDSADRQLETNREWLYCKYAMVAWIDSEIMVNHAEWRDNTLEARYFKMGNAYTEFFNRAQKAYEKQFFSAYEVFFTCFMLGYHGVYQADRTEVPKELPGTDTEWQSQAAKRLARINRPSELTWDETVQNDPENYQLDGRSSIITSALFFVAALVAVSCIWLLVK